LEDCLNFFKMLRLKGIQFKSS